ncbi:MAG TPA: DUF6069 family protein [Longimicrobium sp.]|jgi:hypothetical protein
MISRDSGPPALWAVALASAVLAAGVNSLLFVATARWAFPRELLLPPADEPMTVGVIAGASAAAALAGAATFAVMRRVARDPVRRFRSASLWVLLLSFVAPLAIPAADVRAQVVLYLAHVSVVFGTVWLVTARASRGGACVSS